MADTEYETTDPIIARVRSTLKPLPPVNPMAVARVLSAVHGRRRSWAERLVDRLQFMQLRSLSVASAGGFALAALVIGFMGRGAFDASRDSSGESVALATAMPDTQSAVALSAASAVDDSDQRAVPVQFVLSESSARTVSIVGEFNGWNASAHPLEEVPGSGLWTVTIKLKPGRHVYSFVLDGKRWVRDPQAPEAVDADFGQPQSVIIVQVPWTAGGGR